MLLQKNMTDPYHLNKGSCSAAGAFLPIAGFARLKKDFMRILKTLCVFKTRSRFS
jgi:hypothetical protein